MKIACDRCERILTKENGGLEGIRTLEGLDDGDKWCLCDQCFGAFLAFLGHEKPEAEQEEGEPTCIGYAKDGSCLYMGSGRYGCDGRREECPLPDDVKARMKEVGL